MNMLALTFLLAAAASASAAAPAKAPRFEGRVCKPPSGHHIADCRIARRGTPDLSRAAWRALRGKEVSVDVEVLSPLAPNPAASGARSWPMIDSLAQPMGTLELDAKGRRVVRHLDGSVHRVTGMHMRGHGCAARLDQQQRFMLLQVMARGGGTQAFVDTAALDQATPDGQAALASFAGQLGGGTECAPAGREVSGLRKLTNPRVGAVAHARLSSGVINSVDEYDAKPAYGNVVYFMSNTTAVRAGGITRGMVRVGTAVAKVDTFGYCDPSSDGTLTWRYWSIHTGIPGRGLYGWIPARCPAALKGRKPV